MPKSQPTVAYEEEYSSESNPNTNWMNFRGAWITNLLIIATLRYVFAIIPGTTAELAWTLTNVAHSVGSFIMFHWLQGTPFDMNQGKFDGLTMWEQIDDGQQFTPTKKYLTAVPIFLFLLSTHYTHYDATTFFINLAFLVPLLVAKLPQMHRVRVMGINQNSYDD